MPTFALALIAVAALVVVVAALGLVGRLRRRARLRNRFGREYDHAVEVADRRRDAERDLRAREERRESLEIRPLAPAAASRYLDQWALAQQRFVDEPIAAVQEGHRLVTAVMAERGYPTSSRDERMSMLSVDHADIVQRYRAAAAVQAASRENRATTEDLRQALRDYRVLFDRLIGQAPVADREPYPTEDLRAGRHEADLTD